MGKKENVSKKYEEFSVWMHNNKLNFSVWYCPENTISTWKNYCEWLAKINKMKWIKKNNKWKKYIIQKINRKKN